MPRRRKGEPGVAYNEAAIRNNYGILEYSRTCQAAVAGAVAGILGLVGLNGFIFYFITAALQSGIWLVKAAGNWNAYFVQGSAVVMHSLFGGLFTYVLFWTFLYGMVHVY